MSTLKTDAIEAATGTNTNLALTGKGTGQVALGDATLLWPDADGGSSGDVLQTNGSGTLSFATPSGGAWAVKTSGTASSASSLAITGLTTKYTRIILTNLNGTGGDYSFTMSNDDGSSYISSDYYSTRCRLQAMDAFQLTGQVAWLTGTTTGDQTADDGMWEIDIPNPGSTSCQAWINWRLWVNDASTTSPDIVFGSGGNLATGDIDAIKIAPASGTFSCTYTVIELN